jgi:hypothetical protein
MSIQEKPIHRCGTYGSPRGYGAGQILALP